MVRGLDYLYCYRSLRERLSARPDVDDRGAGKASPTPQSTLRHPSLFRNFDGHSAGTDRSPLWLDRPLIAGNDLIAALERNLWGLTRPQESGLGVRKMGWETGIEPATAGATVRCSAS